jgi:hypothetical protein
LLAPLATAGTAGGEGPASACPGASAAPATSYFPEITFYSLEQINQAATDSLNGIAIKPCSAWDFDDLPDHLLLLLTP